MRNIPSKQPGDPISADEFNSLVAEVQRLGKVAVASPMGYSSDSSGQRFWVNIQRLIVLVKILSTEAQVGRYSGRIISGKSTNQYWDSDALDVEDYGDLPSSDDAEIWDPADIGSSVHSIDPTNPRQQFRHGILIGVTDESTPRKIVSLFDACPFPLGLKYQVWMTVDDNATMAWDYPRFP